MITDYDEGDTAELYTRTKDIPVRSRVEAHSFLHHIGDVRDLDLLDVACGAGHYTRMLARAGAARVAGFDISEKMIALARGHEAQEPLGIDYWVADARTVVPQQDFDIAVAAYLLVYARDRDELAQMCRGLAGRIRPGGRFVTLTTNPDLYHFDRVPDYRKYGFRIRLADAAAEGAPIELTVTAGDSGLVIENYYLPIEAYESALHDAGFTDFRVHLPTVAPPPDGVDEGDFWDDYLQYPPAIVIECARR
ncbi:class I SAM-dependent methyltransferase [Mycobacterium sp. Y57]|uniref:class I SAM-dependent methyltransferase n=1 Tax=Mycolicibacterium xanthum TaxID=2796469 RepID=UPI001C849866|nr:class I SAM-dependent methyltransferase [Mycolicibacterium xanthum]MBX7434605.1 class I SAM-dependent methyltransferase [Mycolicibacterium xanthum]